MERYDFIIIGASVAGSSVAIHLASKGNTVLLIDRCNFPRDRLSTHFMWPRGVSYLNRLGVMDAIAAKTPTFREMHISVENIDMTGAVPLEHVKSRFELLHNDAAGVTDLYCGPRRYFLDEVLLNKAASAGAEIRQGVGFYSVIEENGRVAGINAMTADGRLFSAKARLVIGADGKKSEFADAVNSAVLSHQEESTYAWFGYYSGISCDGLRIKNRGRMGTALFPTSDGTHMVLTYGPGSWWKDFSTSPEKNFLHTIKFCDEALHDMMPSARREQPFKGCNKMVAFKRVNIGPGWVLIGDAASFKDQVTAMGMTHALRDAELLSDCLNRAMDKNRSLDAALTAFHDAREDDYNSYYDFVCQTSKLILKTADELAQVRHVASCQRRTNNFIAQFGDTLPFGQPTAGEILMQDPACFFDDAPLNGKGYDLPLFG
ncbi:NAD(P)/FAD-dependent oxidoreductase [Pseudomonas cerasi]